MGRTENSTGQGTFVKETLKCPNCRSRLYFDPYVTQWYCSKFCGRDMYNSEKKRLLGKPTYFQVTSLVPVDTHG